MDSTIHLNPLLIQNLCRQALAEDIGSGDVTTESVVPESLDVTGQFKTREPCVVAGLPIAKQIFHELDASLEFRSEVNDGETCVAGQMMAQVSGKARPILSGERTALNFVQHLSGIATLASAYVNALGGSNTKILDTRKTTPGLRMLEKYAVAKGGGSNHRHGLFDRVLIKDNHLFIASLAGAVGIKEAIESARKAYPELEIEVEVDTLEQLEEGLEARADHILLDNMSDTEMVEAIALKNEINPGSFLEASGGITLERIPEIAHIGLDFISVGAITHSAKAIDIGLDFSEIQNYPGTSE